MKKNEVGFELYHQKYHQKAMEWLKSIADLHPDSALNRALDADNSAFNRALNRAINTAASHAWNVCQSCELSACDCGFQCNGFQCSYVKEAPAPSSKLRPIKVVYYVVITAGFAIDIYDRIKDRIKEVFQKVGKA